MSVAERKTTGAAPARPRRVNYPESDGKPMAETSEHRDAMTYAIQAAGIILSDRPDVWISGNDFIYYAEGDPKKRVSPDCYIVLGVPRRPRRVFKVWEEEGHKPNLVIEFTSRGPAKEDREAMFDLYQNVLHVPEYILFDPRNEYLRPRLQGYRLVGGQYQPIPITADGHLISQETGIRLFADGVLLRLVDPQTEEAVRTRQEAEAEVERLRAELEALRNQRGNTSVS